MAKLGRKPKPRGASCEPGPNYQDGGRWLDGPKLYKWLDPVAPHAVANRDRVRLGYEIEPDLLDKDPSHRNWPESLRRRMWSWRNGTVADFYEVDKYLTKLGLHPDQIPDDVWVQEPRSRGAWPASIREKVEAELREGVAPSSLARKYGPHPDTIQNWKKRL